MVYHGSEQLLASATGSKPEGFKDFNIAGPVDCIASSATGAVNGVALAVAGMATFAAAMTANKNKDCCFLDILFFMLEDFHD